jgi:tetratricopeptide (TPR) repeat protein
MSRIRRVVCLLLIATSIGLGSATVARAEPKKALVTNVDSIRRFMEKGQTLYLGGQHLRAAEVFDAGYDLHPYSAFLFNAGVALEKGGKLTEAVEHFHKYLEVDPKAPDATEVAKRIERVERLIEEQKQAAATKQPAKEAPQPGGDTDAATKSLVIIETEPPGAPLRIFRRTSGETAFDPATGNPDWSQVLDGQSPMNASLDVGSYHVVVDQFEDNNPGNTAFEVLSGHVLQVKVNLSQGQFMAHLRIVTNVAQAKVYLDDPKREKEPWGKTPLSDFLPAGDHVLLVAATGYEPVKRKVSLARAEQQEIRIDLGRLEVGALRIGSNVNGTQITLDGKPVGEYLDSKPPLEISDLTAGKHFLRLTAKGRKTLETEVEIPKGQALPVTAHLVVLPPRGAAWTQAIISGVLLGGGIYLGLESNRLYDDLKTDRKHHTLANDDPRALRGMIYAIGADVTFLGAAVFGGLSTYNFLSDPLPPSRLVIGRAVEFDTANKPLKALKKSPTKQVSRSQYVPWSNLETVQ